VSTKRLFTGLIWAAAALLAVLATLIWFAPAVMVDVALERATAGRLRLANASGTFWDGKGRIVLADVLADVSTSNEFVGDRTVVQGLVLPGELTWSIRRLPILLGMIDASLRIDGMAAPLRLSGSFNELRLSAGSLNLASMELSKLGSPWNTIRPSALIGLRWNDLTIRSGLFNGKMTIELRDASSVLTPVQPLGSYQIEVSGNGQQAVLNLSTLKGPLNLTGTGSWSDRGGLRFLAQASPDPAERERLQSFLALVGRREGEKTIIKIGA
jgi:general secretion pathway protein N